MRCTPLIYIVTMAAAFEQMHTHTQTHCGGWFLLYFMYYYMGYAIQYENHKFADAGIRKIAKINGSGHIAM